MRYLRALVAAVAAAALCEFSGCGGSGHAPSTEAGTGAVEIRVVWPDDDVGAEVHPQLIPSLSRSIGIRFIVAGSVVGEGLIVRPDDRTTVSDLPAGRMVLWGAAYPKADGTGTALAEAWSDITVLADQVTQERLVLNSAIVSVDVTPSSVSLEVGETAELTATARNADGAVVLVPPSGAYRWEAREGGDRVLVDQDGVVTGLGEGAAIVAATENESGIAGTAEVMVINPWDIETVDSNATVNSTTSLALDAHGWPLISYYDDGGGDLKCARWDGREWSVEVVDSEGKVGWDSSIAVDQRGGPWVCYSSTGTYALKCAVGGGSGWQIEGVDYETGIGPSIAFNGDGEPCASYGGESLRYGCRKQGGWETETVEDLGYYRSTALGIDSVGRPHIAYCYCNQSNQDSLKYAHWDGSKWLSEAVDSTNNVGMWCSLAVDASGAVHMSYYDSGNRDLKYARGDTTGWRREAVDTIGDVGAYTSLALDGSGNPHVAYFDASNAHLKHAWWADGSWHTETVDGRRGMGEFTSIAIDEQSRVHISYADGQAGYDLRYAARQLR